MSYKMENGEEAHLAYVGIIPPSAIIKVEDLNGKILTESYFKTVKNPSSNIRNPVYPVYKNPKPPQI